MSGEQTSEEHDFGHQEDPHPESARLSLLLEIVEVMF